MITRIWHGWTTPQNAQAYEELLRTEIVQGFVTRRIEAFGALTCSDGTIRTKSSSSQSCGSIPWLPCKRLQGKTMSWLSYRQLLAPSFADSIPAPSTTTASNVVFLDSMNVPLRATTRRCSGRGPRYARATPLSGKIADGHGPTTDRFPSAGCVSR